MNRKAIALATAEWARLQSAEITEQSQKGVCANLTTVTCGCGRRRGITLAVKCLYCGVWCCETCAEEHFGKTRQQHKQGQAA